MLGKAGCSRQLDDRDAAQAWQDLALENRGIRPLFFPSAHGPLVSGVLATAGLSGPTAMRGIVAVGAQLRQYGGGISST